MYAAWLLLIFGFSLTRGDERCCTGIGCFTDDYPFNHLPLPRCPDSIPTAHALFTVNNPDEGERLDINTNPTQYFDPTRRTIFIIHGYFNDDSTNWIPEMRNALLNVEDANVIVVGWGYVLDYLTAAATVRSIGAEAAVIAGNLVGMGASYNNMWCVGHSLGAHACAFLGMYAGGSIARVTGLDPAGPWFENYDVSAGINPSVANFVDIIHTMSHSPIINYGMVRPVGDMDFYPNGGDNLQPGCITRNNEKSWIACSHGRAIDYFIESAYDDCFAARETCDDPEGMPNNCYACNDGTPCARMGYNAEGSGPNGIYYLETNSRPDYCRG